MNGQQKTVIINGEKQYDILASTGTDEEEIDRIKDDLLKQFYDFCEEYGYVGQEV